MPNQTAHNQLKQITTLYPNLFQETSFTPKAPIKAILWDLDGTLVDTEALSEIALHKLLAELNVKFDPNDRAQLIGRTMKMNYDFHNEKYGVPIEYDEFFERKMAIYMAMLEDLPPRFPSAPNLINKIHQCDHIKQAIVSNGEGKAVRKSALIYGHDKFEFILSIDETVDGKPSPTPYLMGAEKIGVPIENCLVVEDTPTGLKSAINAGAQTIIAPSDHRGFDKNIDIYKKADLLIDDLEKVDWETLLFS